jgi:hypothetical protein
LGLSAKHFGYAGVKGWKIIKSYDVMLSNMFSWLVKQPATPQALYTNYAMIITPVLGDHDQLTADLTNKSQNL